MTFLEAVVESLVLLLLYAVVQSTGMLEGMSRVMRYLVLGAIFYVGLLALKALWARTTRA